MKRSSRRVPLGHSDVIGGIERRDDLREGEQQLELLPESNLLHLLLPHVIPAPKDGRANALLSHQPEHRADKHKHAQGYGDAEDTFSPLRTVDANEAIEVLPLLQADLAERPSVPRRAHLIPGGAPSACGVLVRVRAILPTIAPAEVGFLLSPHGPLRTVATCSHGG